MFSENVIQKHHLCAEVLDESNRSHKAFQKVWQIKRNLRCEIVKDRYKKKLKKKLSHNK